MILNNTLRLIQDYGPELIDGNITLERLRALEKEFKQVGGYRDAQIPYSDRSHTKAEAMGDFIAAIGCLMPADALHNVVKTLLQNTEANHEQNMLFRDSKLEKYFFSYEKLIAKKQAEQHYDSKDGAIYAHFKQAGGDDDAIQKSIKQSTKMTAMVENNIKANLPKSQADHDLIMFACAAHDDTEKQACLHQRELLFQAIDKADMPTEVAGNIKAQSDKALLGILTPEKYSDLISTLEISETSEPTEEHAHHMSGIRELMQALLDYLANLWSSSTKLESEPMQTADNTIQAMQAFKSTLQAHQETHAQEPDENTSPNISTNYINK